MTSMILDVEIGWNNIENNMLRALREAFPNTNLHAIFQVQLAEYLHIEPFDRCHR
ncbi:MAG: hypothetical protein K0S39_4037 [Paenibacillus sp.]|jgi:hypothetical protein|nr:hypothetical protein [Paenibacillus sp.]